MDVLRSGLKGDNKADLTSAIKEGNKEAPPTADPLKKEIGSTSLYAPVSYKKDDPGLYQATWGTPLSQGQNDGLTGLPSSTTIPPREMVDDVQTQGYTAPLYKPWMRETGSVYDPSFRGLLSLLS